MDSYQCVTNAAAVLEAVVLSSLLTLCVEGIPLVSELISAMVCFIQTTTCACSMWLSI